jgi:alkylation response protein AidB-like acyl-CoA dehydrogenase
MTLTSKMDPEVLSMVLDTIGKLEKERITLPVRLEMDKRGEFPLELIRFMLSPEIALHLIFIPEEYGGLGAGATEIAIVSERMAKMDLAVATSFLAICLGMDPIMVGGDERQKERYIRKIADEGLIVAYGVTEPEAGSNVQALKTKAERVLDETGRVKGYRINGQKQFITNGGVADLYTILADAPGGPSFFVVEPGTEGLKPGKHEDKHGIRASDTCSLFLEDLFVPVENLIGGAEGLGLKQANQVFGYTRLMVATFGLGAGMAALERAIAYSKTRIQFGAPLCNKQGYTHRLLVPNAVRLDAARAYIEKTAKRLDSGDEDLQVEGSISKFFATEAGDAAANDAIQALGGYGYTREYEVEKIKRDIKITTIFEGTSEIQRNIIAMFRMRETVRTKGEFYRKMAEGLEKLGSGCGAEWVAGSLRLINDMVFKTRAAKLTKSQHVLFLLADMMTWAEVGAALCEKAAKGEEHLKTSARLFAREVLEKVYFSGLKIGCGCEPCIDEILPKLEALHPAKGCYGYMKDMDEMSANLLR